MNRELPPWHWRRLHDEIAVHGPDAPWTYAPIKLGEVTATDLADLERIFASGFGETGKVHRIVKNPLLVSPDSWPHLDDVG